MKKMGLRLIATILFAITGVAGLTTSSFAGDWWENVKLNGDFRYRHETIDAENKDIRHRQRIRARVNIVGKVSDESKIMVGISSGSDDPVSNNSTLTGAFSSKDVVLDLAYFEMSPKALPGFKFIGGKAKNPFYKPAKSELIWDGDLRQEGLTLNYSKDFDGFNVKLIGSGLWITERKADDDSYLAGGQALFTYNLSDKKGKITFGGSYFSYGNAEGRPTFFETDDGKGNSVIVTGTGGDEVHSYLTDFELIEAFGTFDFKAGNTPMTLFGDFVTNNAADSLKNAWSVGVKVGKVKKTGSWNFKYIYRNVEKDAVVGAYSDSDFRGGGTDAKGHEVGGSYQLLEKTTLAVTYFNNQIGLENATQTDFQRWQFDLKFKF